jgi:hypothetical protein
MPTPTTNYEETKSFTEFPFIRHNIFKFTEGRADFIYLKYSYCRPPPFDSADRSGSITRVSPPPPSAAAAAADDDDDNNLGSRYCNKR